MARKYNEYLNVDSDFIPVFSVHSDRDYPNKWKAFYPHDSFKSIIKQMVDTLEMSSAEKNKSIWMSGAYGTGKTYASFVIKHLLEDDLDSVKAYCESNSMMDIYARISGVRSKGKTLVVHRSSSASVIGDNRLFNCIIESVKSALKANGYSYYGAKSQYDTVLATLKDPNASFNFERAFEKYKSRFTEYARPGSVINTLENADIDDAAELLETIVEVAEKEHYVWATSVSDVINWLDDIVKQNELYAIVFIWDEFTEFFKNNKYNITGLQEIAQASASIKFYFFLITHGNAQIITDLNARKVIEARFKQSNIEMADATAFKLMSQAIKKKAELKSEWDATVAELWRRVETSVKGLILKVSPDTKESELKELLPIHPYAAYLLKFIAKDISSNQRTMFQFLSGDYNDGGEVKTNFRWFIDNFTNKLDGWNFLTADYIWTYFFTADNVDLDPNFKTVISHYNNYESLCGSDENKKRVLRVALLLTGMQQKSGTSRSGGLTSLLRPTLGNISATFVGTPIESQIANIMSEFTQKGAFSKIQEGDNDFLYIPPMGDVNEEKLNEIKEQVGKDLSFEKLLVDSTYKVYEHFEPNDYLKYRLEIFPTTVMNYRDNVSRALQLKSNKIPVFFVFAKSEIDQGKVKGLIAQIYDLCTRRCIVVDFTEEIFTEINYQKFIQSKAEEKYYDRNPNQANHSKLAKENAKKVVDTWKNKLFVTSLDVYFAADESMKCQGGGNLRKKFREANAQFFGCGLEEISVNDKLFATSGYRETVAQMGMSKLPVPNNYAYLNAISQKLINEGVWNDSQYMINKPSHVVSKMKACVENVVKEGFATNRRVAAIDIWKALQKPPFGLLPCTGTVFLLGFLLKEYADSTFYKYDGANTVSLNYTDLSDLLTGVVKDLPKAKNQYIVEQTPEHAEFCALTGDIFKIAKDKQNTIDDIAKNINIFLIRNEYPLWSLCYYIKEYLDSNPIFDEMRKATELLCEFISTEKLAGRDSTRIAEELYFLYKQTPMLANEMGKIMTGETLRMGMECYIVESKVELVEVTTGLGISSQAYLSALIRKLSADASYLWNKGDIDHQIDNLYSDYYLIASINKLLQEKKSDYQSARKALEDKLNILHIPRYYIEQKRTNLKNVISAMIAVINSYNIPRESLDLGKMLSSEATVFNEFFNNQIELFANIIKDFVDSSADDEEIKALFDRVPSGVFFKKADEFVVSITSALKSYRQNKKVNQLRSIWKRKTGTDNALQFCNKLQFPILTLFVKERMIADETFGIINNYRTPSSLTIDKCLEFISSESFNIVFDEAKRNQCFLLEFCGEYSCLIEDVNALKEHIFNKLGCSIFDWSYKVTEIRGIVKAYAEKIYRTSTVKKVKEKIKGMNQETIAQYLMQLIEDKPLVGIEILKDGE